MTKFQVIEPGSFSEWVWDNKYRLKQPDGTPIDETVEDTFIRVSDAVAKAEVYTDRSQWTDRFFEAMSNFEFLPAGRILAGAGSGRDVTMLNCYVMGTIPDSLEGIMNACTEAALTLKQGGGVGMDFSTLRPRGALVKGVDSVSSGAVSFMDLWNTMCGTIMSAGARRGAMMGTLRVDHPDIEEFIAAKQTAGRLTNFNVSVLVTDEFMLSVRKDRWHDLQFDGTHYGTVRARDLWDQIIRSTYDHAEPGVIFIDRVNERNQLNSIETISATNPCGEQPLPPYGACLLGSINLARLVKKPFTADARIAFDRLSQIVPVAVRFLDNVLDISNYPLIEQHDEAMAKRRIGLGITGLADALVMMGAAYQNSDLAAGVIMERIKTLAMKASIEIGEEKGHYPAWRSAHGEKRRNSHLISIAPTGTISAFAGNVSSGIEPAFEWTYKRNVLLPDGSKRTFEVEDYAHRLARSLGMPADGKTPLWSTATELSPSDHLKMVAACQPHVDSAISKTINCPKDIPFEQFEGIYRLAYESGLKGCTTYRPTPSRGAVLMKADEPKKVEITANDDRTVVQIGKPLSRPKVLDGKTYKIKAAGMDHAFYVTVTDIEDQGRRRPFELFIQSKQIDGQAWAVALSRMVSAVFRRGGDVAFVADELKAVFDPRGGFFDEGAYVPSLCAAIGGVIETHMRSIGAVEATDEPVKIVATRHCPKCQVGALQNREGCWHCTSCDYTKC